MAIDNISDTARWVAVYRAMETARPDAIFRDPFAERLAGEQGHQILDEMPSGRALAWPMIVRTAVFDEIIMGAVQRKADLVVNLAAGLDARPWRLPLPPSLRWVDVDLPGILNFKTEMLRNEKPVCHYEAVTADLTDVQQRQTLFAQFAAGSSHALVVTEGLLIYLTPDQVAALATDLHAQPSFKEWLIDLASPQLLQRMSKTWGKNLKAAGAPFRFAPAEGVEFFRPYGWREEQFRSTWEEATRLKRTMKGAWFWNLIGRLFPKKVREGVRRFSGNVLLARE
ncbi:MAG TPA: SAM-dependent methyltransferase [Thermoanaerobaculia bacterium]|jgi:methyltransferase (TIGR00027 family)|nr:SAM-dependent methyltransferase [Thermoanaerobaculia bacterium]